jgi:hypothetical protein
MWSNMDGSMKEEPSSLHRIKEEIIDFFASNPFLLVSEDWLASLICRPARLVEEAVLELLAEGTLEKRDRHILLGHVEGSVAHPEEGRVKEGGRNASS